VSTRDFLIARRNAECPAFRKVLDALPNDRWDYRPHERSPSAAGIVWTMVAETQACCELVERGAVDWNPGAAPADPEAIRRLHEQSYQELTRLITSLDADGWARPAQFRVAGTTKMEMPVEQFLWFFFFDAIHHRGQLSTYIRPMGGKVPAIYGPSADDPGEMARA
jgi:uncharacterized damage-inducible protein DinB